MSCGKSQFVRLVFDETPAEDCHMEFRLVYSGRVLGASRSDTRATLKHQIRREFHPQLRRLWQTNSSLQSLIKYYGLHVYDEQNPRNFSLDNLGRPPDVDKDEDFYVDFGAEALTKNWARCGYKFWPLITEDFPLRCSLDILFLRPEEPGMLVRSGDLDARVKTIFDALRMPNNLAEAGGIGPQADEDPFYCLLQDDKMISEIKVTTDHLLLLPHEREIQANDALLIIHVKLWPMKVSRWDWAFMS